MQIHEITYSRVDEGILDKVGAGIQGAKAAYKQSKINRQTDQMADKAYGVWDTYARQLEQFAASKGPEALKAFQDRSDGIYQKSLMAFVQKNLLGGNQLNKLINKDDIINLVNKISAPQQVVPVAQPAQAQQQVAPVAQPSTPAQTQPAQVAPAQAQQPTARTNTPAQTQGRVPSTPAGAPRPVAPVQAPKARVAQKPKQVPRRAMQEAAGPQNIKDLFKQLVQATALAMPDVTGGTGKKKNATPGTQPQVQPAPTTAPATDPEKDVDNLGMDSGIYIPTGRRLKIEVKNKGQDIPSFYYKNSDGVWTNELGKPVKPASYSALEKYLTANGGKTENDPYYVSPEEQKKSKGKRKK